MAAARKTESPSALVLRGPGISVDQHQELLLRSSHASQVCFPAVIEFCADDQPGLDTVVFDQQPGCLRVTVDHAEGRDELVITEGARPGLVVTRESSPPAAPEQNRIEVAVAADEVPLVTYRD